VPPAANLAKVAGRHDTKAIREQREPHHQFTVESAMTNGHSGKWIRTARANCSAPFILYCFPWAGGASSLFSRWAEELSDIAEVRAIQLPAREDRLREEPFRRVDDVLAVLTPIIEQSMDRPCALFGHSLGAILAFETARRLSGGPERRLRHLFVSGSEPPESMARATPRHLLPDRDFLEAIRDLNGTSPIVLAEPRLMEIYLRLLRADFEMAETYRPGPAEPLDVPITAIGGTEDREADAGSLSGWQAYSSLPLIVRLVAGDHFFLVKNRSAVLEIVGSVLRQL
jgi:medium-chain acyl-[acyl-carrier-protein] hydrolase